MPRDVSLSDSKCLNSGQKWINLRDRKIWREKIISPKISLYILAAPGRLHILQHKIYLYIFYIYLYIFCNIKPPKQTPRLLIYNRQIRSCKCLQLPGTGTKIGQIKGNKKFVKNSTDLLVSY